MSSAGPPGRHFSATSSASCTVCSLDNSNFCKVKKEWEREQDELETERILEEDRLRAAGFAHILERPKYNPRTDGQAAVFST